MRIYALIIGASWIVFLGVWLVLSIAGVGGRNRTYSPLRSILRLLLVVALVLGTRYGDRIPMATFGRFTVEIAAAGSALCVIGLAFAIWARVTLGRNWGMPMTLHAQPELVTSGPYVFVRHPIYTGVATMFIGTALVFPITAIWGSILIAYFVFSARREERDMAQRFPETYPPYKQRSKMLVPFLF